MLWLILAMLGLAAVIAVALGDSGTLVGLDGGTLAALIASVALLIFIAGPFLTGQRGQLSKNLKDLLIWVGIMLILVLGYSFRDDAKHIYQRIAGELLPPGHTLSVTDDKAGQQAVRIRKQPNGHFTARATVNGQAMMLLVDTGASSIVLKASDARAAGINVSQLKFRVPVRTANGVAYAAATQISSIAVGSITMHNMNIMVAKPGVLSESLLGMNFLTRLRSYEFSGDFLTLRG
ncbi:MAG: aspartyl protease family protein [Alphaproteobacteria bacterium]|jgi:aspartyl protease family protein